MVTRASGVIEELLWPSRGRVGLVMLVMLLSCTVCRTNQETRDIVFLTQPTSQYVVFDRTFSLHCRAQAVDSEEFLSVAFYKNDELIPIYPPTEYHYLYDSVSGTTTGLVSPQATITDNGATFQCKLLADDSIMTPPITITVADGRPGPITLTEDSKTISTCTVTWEVPLLPVTGPLLGYNLSLFAEDGSLMYTHTVADSNITSFTIDDLEPDTDYQVLVVAYNTFGLGNESNLFPIRTLAPSVPNPVQQVMLKQSGVADVLISWQAPEIDPSIMTTITQYNISYYPTANDTDVTTLAHSDVDSLEALVTGLVVGTEYVFSVVAINSAGPSAMPNDNLTKITLEVLSPNTSSSAATSTLVITNTSSTPVIASTSVIAPASTSVVASTAAGAPVVRETTVVRETSAASPSPSVSRLVTPTVDPTTDRNSSPDNISEGSPVNLIVIIVSIVASIIMIAIIIVAFILIGFCIYTCNNRDKDEVDYHPEASKWPHHHKSMKACNSKDSTIKGSSLSGSISHSLSSEHDIPELPYRTVSNGAAAAVYTVVPTDSPPSKASDDAYGSIIIHMPEEEKSKSTVV